MKHFNRLNRDRLFATARVLLFAIICSTCNAAPSCGELKACGAEALQTGDLDAAYTLLLPEAESGDTNSQIAIALILSNGGGTPLAKKGSKVQRERLALPWIERAARKGNPEAINWLADGYKYGWFGFSVNSAKEQCLRRSASERRDIAPCFD